MLIFEEVEKRVEEVGGFSSKLEEILLFLLKETREIRETVKSENEARKAELESATKALEASIQGETLKLRDIIKKADEERQRDMRDIEAFVKKESAERRKGLVDLEDKLTTGEQKRLEEAKQLAEKMEKEKKALQEYVEKDARESAERMAASNKALQEKLDKEASELKKKLQDADEEKGEEMKIMQNKLDLERKMLNERMEREKNELAEEMERAEVERKRDADKLKNRMEEEAKQTQSGIVTMFERLKGENESRKTEIHGLKDILVRENEKTARDQLMLAQKLDNGMADLNEKMDREVGDVRKDLKRTSDDLTDTIRSDKKEINNKIENEYTELKKKVELETNEIRDKMQFDKKAIIVKFEEVEDERQKEAKLIRAQLQREREDTKDLINGESKMLQDQVDGNTRELMEIIKREKAEREREIDSVKRKMDDEKDELQISINRDRDNLTKRLNDEHDQRRIEQMEVQQRLENTEKSGKNDVQDLFGRIKRYEEEARLDNDEVRQALTRTCASLDEKLIRDKKELREMVEHETLDLGKRVDKCNMERLNEGADVQSKLALLGKSASRHIDSIKHKLHSETQNLLELMTKTGSVAFSANRDDGHSCGGECYVTFTTCTVNIGNGFIPKSGIFQCPEPGLYFFTLTVCTYDGKKCLLILRKNEKDVCAMIDQDGNENRGKTMINQSCFMELEIGDRVQVYAVTGTGLSDTKSSHYTQFSGVILRPSMETVRSFIRNTQAEEDDDRSIREGSIRAFTPTPSSAELRAAARSRNSVIRTLDSASEHGIRTLEPEPPKLNGTSQENGVRDLKSPTPRVLSPTPKEKSLKEVPGPKEAGKASKEGSKEAGKEKTQQSYLALTGLGGTEKKNEPESPKTGGKSTGSPKTGGKSTGSPQTGGKSSVSPNAEEKPSDSQKTGEQSKKPEPSSFYSFLKR